MQVLGFEHGHDIHLFVCCDARAHTHTRHHFLLLSRLLLKFSNQTLARLALMSLLSNLRRASCSEIPVKSSDLQRRRNEADKTFSSYPATHVFYFLNLFVLVDLVAFIGYWTSACGFEGHRVVLNAAVILEVVMLVYSIAIFFAYRELVDVNASRFV